MKERDSFSLYNVTCSKNWYFCKRNKICINILYVCDGHADCKFNEDEEDCPKLKSYHQFKCINNDEFVKYNKVCNFQQDCPDNSDEMFCGVYILSHFLSCNFFSILLSTNSLWKTTKVERIKMNKH